MTARAILAPMIQSLWVIQLMWKPRAWIRRGLCSELYYEMYVDVQLRKNQEQDPLLPADQDIGAMQEEGLLGQLIRSETGSALAHARATYNSGYSCDLAHERVPPEPYAISTVSCLPPVPLV